MNASLKNINSTTFANLDEIAEANNIGISNSMLQYMTDEELNPTAYPTVVSYEYVLWGFGEVFVNADAEINKSTMDSIYSVFEKKGTENGIEDFPLVFVSVNVNYGQQAEQESIRISNPTDDLNENTGGKILAQEDTLYTSKNAPGLDFSAVAFLVIMAFFASKKVI
ncbi:hypothetical protein [uncultured Methanolobus sp.]|uniref:hypothetical protein n=1 Tax=uncultured Methanolobus sp. TaxID=218300 RepID=UPI002AAAFAFF|nr:hypothetical protein [uncultured Methanolobus sp.]